MMDDRDDLPSDSEESDVDYVPSGEEGQLSEEESDGDVEDGKVEADEHDPESKSLKRTKSKSGKSKKSRKRARVATPEPEEPETAENLAKTEEEKKKKADDIWAAFKQETSVKAAPKEASTKDEKQVTVAEQAKPEKVTRIFEFAGEKVEVTEEVKPSASSLVTQPMASKPSTSGPATKRKVNLGIIGRGCAGVPCRTTVGGLAGVLGSLNKKNKLSTLEKSKLDWEGFKRKEGIDEEIQSHNKGKHGYLEKQDFLQRADLRQFELEKQMRTTVRRSNR